MISGGRLFSANRLLSQHYLTIALCLLLISFISCKNENPTSENGKTISKSGKTADETAVESLITAEDLILDLTPKLASLSRDLIQQNRFQLLTIDGDKSSGLETLKDLASCLVSIESNPGIFSGAIAGATADLSKTNDPWKSFNQFVTAWKFAKFGIKSGEFIGDDNQIFKLKTVFYGRCRSQQLVIGVNAAQTVKFKNVAGNWQLISWNQEKFDLTASAETLFENVTMAAIPQRQVRESVTRSIHEEYIVNVVHTGITPVYDRKYLPFVDAEMSHASPSVSVADLDQDGWDDLFITARWSRPVYLHNQKDGTFADRTKEIGIDLRGLVNCSCFVDFDNDGDTDLILGRAMESVLVMENREGKFYDITHTHTDLEDLYFVSAISASDINRDGLLDFYLSTYGPAGDNRGVDWKSMFLSPEQAKILAEKERTDHMWVDFPGPPNVVVMNRGQGKLQSVPVDRLVSQWHNSFQSAWGDFDQDGDDDLYVCNDFAPGGFLINETPTGSETPVLKDGIPGSFPTGTMGFSMGVSWADFDCDSDLDLYVSNMYSKAGKRILGRLADNDPRFIESAAGNYLFRNENGQFSQIAGPNNDQVPVHQVGWSYGGQFADFNNDGKSDIYVPSGFFTAPDVGASEVDL